MTHVSPQLTLDQKRAQFAWEKASALKDKPFFSDYVNLAKATPSLIMTSGLMQTLAFLRAKGKDQHNQHKELLNQLCQWLERTLGGAKLANGENFPGEGIDTFETIMPALHQSPSDLYMRVTEESMALLRWLRQFGDALKSKEQNKGQPHE